MTLEQYQQYCEDNCTDNTLKWLCHSSQDQDKGNTQKEMPIAWGKMKDIKEIRNVSIWHVTKLQDGKELFVNPKKKSWKNTNC